ncbi:MAG: hypothetical protein LUH05_08335 [Candidatus Gastranaerophilales bacterium]|nr:hypothetical protein [Candidatus Gastranaerophilales bacterium]
MQKIVYIINKTNKKTFLFLFLFFVIFIPGIIKAGKIKYIKTISNIEGNTIVIVLIKNVNINAAFAASLFTVIKHIALAVKIRNRKIRKVKIPKL